ncbi:MAG: shikimate dehydrogenase [Bacteroides sp.]|nr:shikimate dehydrogenase [Prevotella sp.]MCM1407134.1 shikimate dehydrogenase [Treponema brennaborense]MCM1470286.1 shikimate dehydrogenase [Bacteroides sp.]
MSKAKICLCLTGSTLEEDLAMLNKYRKWIDIAELRVDYLTKDEQLQIRKFPAMTDIPCILTIRRTIDGGLFNEGETYRTILMARGLAFADQDTSKNFAYIDMEDDFDVPSLQDSAVAFGTRVIRSHHNMNEPIKNIAEYMKKMMRTGYEIPKIACMPHTLADVTDLFRQAKELENTEHILITMGPLGLPSRILASKLHSFITYTSPAETLPDLAKLGQIDPISLNETYHFREIDEQTKVYGITGFPLTSTQSPQLHNHGYKKHSLNAVYIPIRSEKIEDIFDFMDEAEINGLSVTVPHKEQVMHHLHQISEETGEIGACNTIIKRGGEWIGYNTDAAGLRQALCEFLGTKSLAHKRVAIIGAGGAAKAAAYVVKQMRGNACVFNRTVTRARSIADMYNFKYASLSENSIDLLDSYSDLIIQTTSCGMNASETEYKSSDDPLSFYNFSGREAVYDLIYTPEKTPLLRRAEKAGCKIQNGKTMLMYQAYKQFLLFTGIQYVQ